MPPATAPQAPKTKEAVEVNVPKNPVMIKAEFVKRIQDDYLAQVCHVFLVTGNVFDFMDPMGSRMSILDVLGGEFDSNVKKANAAMAKKLGFDIKVPEKNKILAFYTADAGLQFLTKASEDAFAEVLTGSYSEEERAAMMLNLKPKEFGDVMDTLNSYFSASKRVVNSNRAIKEQGAAAKNIMLKEELNTTVVFVDSHFNMPNGDIAHMERDRQYIAMLRAWSRDTQLGNRNKVILIAPSASDLNECLRNSDAYIASITVKKPNLATRHNWLTQYNETLKRQVTGGCPAKINGQPWTEVRLAEGETLEDIAIQAAGMNFKQLEGPILSTAVAGQPLSCDIVRKVKQQILETEYGGVIEFVEPVNGFEIIGGHEHLKRYARERIITPLKTRDKNICSRGVLLTGPPGTGKTEWAMALAKEAGLNFILAHMDKLKDGIVGSSEKLMRKFLEAVRASAPCLLFLDEIDQVFGPSAREGARDGGVQAGQFTEFMKFLSDPSRVGEIVVIAATNRPDMLDAALIRPGRFDDILPALPPKADDIAGRMQILFAIMNRKKLVFAPELKGTEKGEDGLALFTNDKRIWTGAEINKLIEDAVLGAILEKAERKTKLGDKYRFEITKQDWEDAIHNIIPNTGDMHRMIGMALYFINNMRYCPVGWEAETRNIRQVDRSKVNSTLDSYTPATSYGDRQ